MDKTSITALSKNHPSSFGRVCKAQGKGLDRASRPFRVFSEESMLHAAIERMKAVFEPLPVGIDHTLEVLSFVQAIAAGEAISGPVLQTAELAAVLHDIGAVKALQVHGSIESRFQELEGPPIAREILTSLSRDESLVDRVCYIVGHHHTASAIDGDDFRLLWDADRIAALGHEGFTESIDSLAAYARGNLLFRSSADVALKRYFPSAS